MRQAAAPAQRAILIAEDSVAQSQVVALGRDLIVRGRVKSDVAAIRGSVEVLGSVEGDVVVLGGDALIGPQGRVGGDVFALGGTITESERGQIGGRAVAYPTAPSAWILLAEGPALGLSPWSPVVVGSKLALMAAWLLTVAALLAVAAPAVARTAFSVEQEPFRDFFTGLVAVLALILTAVFFSSFAGVLLGLPLLVLLILVALTLKLHGMVAVFLSFGIMIQKRIRVRGRESPFAASYLGGAVTGLLVLGVLKFVPWIGGWVWTAATFIGVGACLRTKFGRREGWFEA